MNYFTYVRATDMPSAMRLWQETSAQGVPVKFLAGGTNLVDLMREGVEQPRSLVDITRLPLAEIEQLSDGGVRIGALVRNSRLAAHPLVSDKYPLLSSSDSQWRLGSVAQHGNNRRQPYAAHAVLLLLRHCHPL